MNELPTVVAFVYTVDNLIFVSFVVNCKYHRFITIGYAFFIIGFDDIPFYRHRRHCRPILENQYITFERMRTKNRQLKRTF